MLREFILWSEQKWPHRIPVKSTHRKRRRQVLNAILYSLIGYQIPTILALIGVSMGNDRYGVIPYLGLYAGILLSVILSYLITLKTRVMTTSFLRRITAAQLAYWLFNFGAYVYLMNDLRSVALLCALLTMAHLIIVGEMLACGILTGLTVITYLAVTAIAVNYGQQPAHPALECVSVLGFLAISLYLAHMGVSLRRSRDHFREVTRDLQNAQASLQETMGTLEQAAMRDALTGLWNRRAAQEVLAQAQILVTNRTQPATILLMDLDHFKRINDTHGHEGGDQVLLSVSRLLLERARGDDMVVRWGGEEFLLLFRNTELTCALSIADRIRREVSEVEMVHEGATIKMSFSGGLAELSAERSLKETLALADRRLYAAKTAGRNRVEAAGA